MSHRRHRSRRSQHASHANAQVSLASEIMESRQVLSVINHSFTQPTIKDISVTASYDLPNPGYSLEIDAVAVKSDKVHVFSTIYPPDPGTISPQVITHVERSLTVTAVVLETGLTIEYHYGFSGNPSNELFHLLRGSANLLYQNPDVDVATAWPINDVSESNSSPLDLGLRAGPAAPQGFAFKVDPESKEITVWFDERSSFDAIAANRHLRRYSLTGYKDASVNFSTTLLMEDDQFFDVTLPGQSARRFGGKVVLRGQNTGVFADELRIRVQELPYFPDGATNINAMATDWSDSTTQKLPLIQSQNVVAVSTGLGSTEDGKPVIRWAPVENADTYELWIKSVKGDRTLLRRASINATDCALDSALDPGDYRIWVRAIRHDGSLTSWGIATVSVAAPSISIDQMLPTGDKTPTIRWTGSGHASSVIVRIIDEAKEEQAKAMRFTSDAARTNFITAYSATLPGSPSEHELSTPIAEGYYRVIVIEQFSNGESAFGRKALVVDPGSVSRPMLTGDPLSAQAVRVANFEPHADGYDIWVAYLGTEFGNSSRTSFDRQYGNWQFARVNGSTTGRYQLPADAPAGRYRVWMRATDTVDGKPFKTEWGTSWDLTQQPTLTSEGNTIRWSATPGADGYQVELRWGGTSFYSQPTDISRASTSIGVSSSAGTSLTLPMFMDGGRYWARVIPMGVSIDPNETEAIGYVDHQLPTQWNWDVRYATNSLQWNRVPNAIRYQVELTDGPGQVVVPDIIADTTAVAGAFSTMLPSDYVAGSYQLRIRALRSINGVESWSLWESKRITIGVDTPTGLAANGTTVTWDPQTGVSYNVIIEQLGRDSIFLSTWLGGWKSASNGAVITLSSYRPNSTTPDPFAGSFDPPVAPNAISGIPGNPIAPAYRQFREVTGINSNSIDLKNVFTQLYSIADPTDFRITVIAVQNGIESAPAELEFSVPVFPLSEKPIVENIKQTAPLEAPQIQSLRRDGTIVFSHGGTSLPRPYRQLPLAGIQRQIDQEYAVRLQLNVTNVLTGQSQLINESEIGLFMSGIRDSLPVESPRWILNRPGTQSLAYPGPNFNNQTQLPADVINRLFGTSGVYQVQARVQYIPVMFSDVNQWPVVSDLTPFNPSTDVAPRMNVAITPWSDWSSSFEFTVLPTGAKVVPIPFPAEVMNARPQFAWGVEEDRSQLAFYELWVENAVSKQRVIRQTIERPIGSLWQPLDSSPMRYNPTSDLPPGTYTWWVRKVGDTGQRNGWSQKQTLEVIANPTSVTVDSKTVDSTPVISWQHVANAESYLIQVRSVSSGAVIYSATEPANRLTHRVNSILANGDYHVIVEGRFAHNGRTATGKLLPNGQLVPITMSIGARPENITVSRNQMTWQSVTGATRYQVFIQFAQPDGVPVKVVDEVTSTNSFTLPSSITRQPGEYRIWIRAIRNEAGQQSTGLWSNRVEYHVPIETSTRIAADEYFDLTSIVMSELAIASL